MKYRLTLLFSFALIATAARAEQCRGIGSPNLLPWDYSVSGSGVNPNNSLAALDDARNALRAEIAFCRRVCDSVKGKFTSEEYPVTSWRNCTYDGPGIASEWDCTAFGAVRCQPADELESAD